MYFGFFLALLSGILLVVLSVNGRLQPTIAAMFGQQSPSATPVGNSANPSAPGGNPWLGLLGPLAPIFQQLLGGSGGAPNPFGDNPPGQTQGGVPYLP